MSNPVTTIELKNLREIVKILKELEGNYISEFYKEAKDIAKGVQSEVIKGISNSAPISGMKGRSLRARMAWGVGKRAKSVTLKANRAVKRGSSFAKGKTSSYPLIQVVASSPALVIADMAGKANKSVSVSRTYEINLFGRGVITREHRINGQGKAMISKLTATAGQPSRFFWPAALKGMPEATEKMGKLVAKLHTDANRELGS
jgi:hypothetical protein